MSGCRGPMSRIASLLALIAALALGQCALAGTNESSFTPDSILVPVRAVGFENSATGADTPIYTCPGGSESACRVDFTDQAALAGLFAGPSAITPGTYDRLYVSTCTTEGSYSALVRGRVTLGGTTYYTADTSAGGDPLTTSAAAEGYTSVRFDGCRRRYNLPAPVTIAAGDTIDLSLFVTNVNIAWARLGSPTIPSGCRTNAAHTQSVCMAYPDAVPYLGTASPVLERYYIVEDMTHPSHVGGMILLVTDPASDAVLAGFTRRYFSADSVPPNGTFDTPLKSIVPASDGSYALESYGSTATATDTGYLRFGAFRRRSHSGTYLEPDGTSVPYYAYRDIARELPSCPAGPLFTTAPVMIDNSVTPAVMPDFNAIVPLGNFNPGGGHVFPTDHIYFYLKLVAPGGDTVTSTVYAPGDAWVTAITRQTATAGTSSYTDYTVRFALCREVSAYFHHIRTLSPALAAAYSAVPLAPGDCGSHVIGGTTYTTCTAQMKQHIGAGDLVGDVGGNRRVFAFDFGATDARIAPLTFANPSRFSASPDGNDIFHTVCPIDYFTATLRNTLRGFLGDFDGTTLRTVPPLCGTIEQDIAGTAQGIWFEPGAPTYPESPHLALVHGNVDPTQGVFSVGDSVTASGLAVGTYYFTPSTVAGTHVNPDFADVVPGDVYCYEGLSNRSGPASMTVLLQMTDPTTLRIEKRAATSCAALGAPSAWSLSSYTEFQR